MKAAADRDAHACSDGLSRPFDAMGTMVFFRVLGSLLYHEPTEEAIRGLKEGRLFDDLPFEAGDAGLLEGQKAMSDWLASAPVPLLVSEARCEYMRLLVGVGETLASPWASVYLDRDGLLFGDETLRVRAELRRHGQELKEKHHEPDDHLGIELEFVASLLERDEVAEAQRFARERMATWVHAWNADVQENSRCGYYRALGMLADAGVRLLAGRG